MEDQCPSIFEQVLQETSGNMTNEDQNLVGSSEEEVMCKWCSKIFCTETVGRDHDCGRCRLISVLDDGADVSILDEAHQFELTESAASNTQPRNKHSVEILQDGNKKQIRSREEKCKTGNRKRCLVKKNASQLVCVSPSPETYDHGDAPINNPTKTTQPAKTKQCVNKESLLSAVVKDVDDLVQDSASSKAAGDTTSHLLAIGLHLSAIASKDRKLKKMGQEETDVESTEEQNQCAGRNITQSLPSKVSEAMNLFVEEIARKNEIIAELWKKEEKLEKRLKDQQDETDKLEIALKEKSQAEQSMKNVIQKLQETVIEYENKQKLETPEVEKLEAIIKEKDRQLDAQEIYLKEMKDAIKSERKLLVSVHEDKMKDAQEDYKQKVDKLESEHTSKLNWVELCLKLEKSRATNQESECKKFQGLLENEVKEGKEKDQQIQVLQESLCAVKMERGVLIQKQKQIEVKGKEIEGVLRGLITGHKARQGNQAEPKAKQNLACKENTEL